MHRRQFSEFDLDENGLALLLGEFDHRISNLLMMIEAAVRQTKSASVEEYRAKLMQPILSLRHLYEKARWYGTLELTALIEHTSHPYCVNGAPIVTSGPELPLEPNLAFALHLVFHELALNSSKYGAMSSERGCVKVTWKIRDIRNARRKLAIVWSEEGGPRVRRPAHRGFGLGLMKKALDGHGGLRVEFNPGGLSCFMLVDVGHGQGMELQEMTRC